MKNKNNYSVKQLVDKIQEVCSAKYPTDPSMKWAYTTGILESILDFEVRGYAKHQPDMDLQSRINSSYLRYEEDLKHETELAASRD
jgi:hypothetical protein